MLVLVLKNVLTIRKYRVLPALSFKATLSFCLSNCANISCWYFSGQDCLMFCWRLTNTHLSVWYSLNLFQIRSLFSLQTAIKQSNPAVGLWYLLQAIKLLNTNAKYRFFSLTVCLFPSFSSFNYSLPCSLSLEAANLTGKIKPVSSSLFILTHSNYMIPDTMQRSRTKP